MIVFQSLSKLSIKDYPTQIIKAYYDFLSRLKRYRSSVIRLRFVETSESKLKEYVKRQQEQNAYFDFDSDFAISSFGTSGFLPKKCQK